MVHGMILSSSLERSRVVRGSRATAVVAAPPIREGTREPIDFRFSRKGDDGPPNRSALRISASTATPEPAESPARKALFRGNPAPLSRAAENRSIKGTERAQYIAARRLPDTRNQAAAATPSAPSRAAQKTER
jgi:hypothetical protein